MVEEKGVKVNQVMKIRQNGPNNVIGLCLAI